MGRAEVRGSWGGLGGDEVMGRAEVMRSWGGLRCGGHGEG